jgi:cysteine desulfurase/selenocysteine lyase
MHYFSSMITYSIYLDTAAAGMVSDQTLRAGRKYEDEQRNAPSSAFFAFLENDYPRVKQVVANFCRVDAHHLAFIPNFSYGLTALLPSLNRKHTRVLLLENDYPSLTLPFQLFDFEISRLPSKDGFSWELAQFEASFKQFGPEILAISQVQYLTGAKLDIDALAALCRQYGVLLLVDATQSLGAMPIDFRASGIDVLIASNYKWMNSGFGSGLMCFREGFFDDYPPAIGGFGSFKHVDGEWQYVPGSSSFQPGHFNFSNLLMLEQSILEKNALGLDAIAEHNRQLASYFLRGATQTPHKLIGPPDMTNRSSIICLEADLPTYTLFQEAGIRCTFRNNSIRIAFHTHNTEADADAALAVLQST